MLKISFFSYKGGAGRSTLALNVVPYMAEKLNATRDHPMILVDMDIDSAGLSFLLGQSKIETVKNRLSVQSVFRNIGVLNDVLGPNTIPLEKHPFFSNLDPVGKELGLNVNESVLFLRASPGDYIKETNYDVGGTPLSALVRLCEKYGCKAIVFDTPAGDQITATMSIGESKKIVCCMRVTYQFQNGTIRYVTDKDKEYSEKEFIIVPNAVPREEILVDGKVYDLSFLKGRLLDAMSSEKIKSNRVNVDMFSGALIGIPEVKRFKVKESVLRFSPNKSSDEEEATERFIQLAEILCKGGL